MSWLESIREAVCSHFSYYIWFAGDQWRHLTPVKYSILLVTIGVVGFLMMGRGSKRI